MALLKTDKFGRKPVALVTGGARGIGYASALELAKHGFLIALNDLAFDGHRREKILEDFRAFGEAPLLIEKDVSAIERHPEMLEEVLDVFGFVDTLVSSAGVSVMHRGDITEATPESYDRCQSINTRSVFFLCQTLTKYFAKNPDCEKFRSLILISSLNSQAVSINRSEYCVSKAGVSMIAKLFADRLASLGAGVYEVLPGIIETEMTKPSMEKYKSLIANGLTPFGRAGQPVEVGKPIAALASGYFPYTTGQAITVDGGTHMIRY